MTWEPGKPVEMETRRFFVRSLKPEDADENYTSWWNDAEIQRGFNQKPRNWDIPRAAQHIEKFNNQDRFHLGIIVKETLRLIGFITIIADLKQKIAKTNVGLGDKTFWGKDVIIEVREHMLDFIFLTLGMEKAESEIIGRNFSSIFNNKVLGYASEGILRKHSPSVEGGRADTYLFGLLKREWQESKKDKKETLSKPDKALTNSGNFKTAKELLAEATYYNSRDIPDSASVDTWGSWDSLSHVRLILAMEHHLGRELEPDIVVDISNLQDVARFISVNKSLD